MPRPDVPMPDVRVISPLVGHLGASYHLIKPGEGSWLYATPRCGALPPSLCWEIYRREDGTVCPACQAAKENDPDAP